MTARIVAFLLRLAAVLVLLWPLPFFLAFFGTHFPGILVSVAPFVVMALILFYAAHRVARLAPPIRH